MPVVLLKSALTPLAVLSLAGCVVIERCKTGGRVVAAGCEAEERVIALSGVGWDSLRPALG